MAVSELARRTLFAVVAIPIVLGAVYVGDAALAALLAIAAALAAWEFFRMAERGEYAPLAAIADPTRKLYGIQFHPEVAHTPRGLELLKSFLFDVAGLSPSWTPGSFVDEAIAKIKEQVPDNARVISVNAERVLTARLRDAQFFWDADRKVTLDSRLPRLSTLLFQRPSIVPVMYMSDPLSATISP